MEDEEEIDADLERLDFIIQPDNEAVSKDDVPELAEDIASESDEEKGFEVVKRTDAEKQWEDEAPRRDGKLGRHHRAYLQSLRSNKQQILISSQPKP